MGPPFYNVLRNLNLAISGCLMVQYRKSLAWNWFAIGRRFRLDYCGAYDRSLIVINGTRARKTCRCRLKKHLGAPGTPNHHIEVISGESSEFTVYLEATLVEVRSAGCPTKNRVRTEEKKQKEDRWSLSLTYLKRHYMLFNWLLPPTLWRAVSGLKLRPGYLKRFLPF